MIQEIEAFPLHWPMGYKRTPSFLRINSKFKVNMDTAQQQLRLEIKRLGGKNLVVSTNIPVRKDGGLYVDWMSKKIDDPGVAIYFSINEKNVSMCCDKFFRIWENVYALAKGIEALRGMDRWGVSEFLERAFTGFTGIPETVQAEKDIWDILGLSVKPDSIDVVKSAYRNMAKICHPDIPGGSHYKMQQLNDAYEKALSFYN